MLESQNSCAGEKSRRIVMCRDAVLCGEWSQKAKRGLSTTDERTPREEDSPHKGHRDLSTTQIYTHVFNRGGYGVRSPADRRDLGAVFGPPQDTRP